MRANTATTAIRAAVHRLRTTSVMFFARSRAMPGAGAIVAAASEPDAVGLNWLGFDGVFWVFM